MEICWDTLEGVYLTKNGIFRKNTVGYTYYESCKVCGDPYLAEKRRQSNFCGRSCAHSGENHHFYGKTFSIEYRNKVVANLIHGSGALNSNYKGGVTKLGLVTYANCKATLGPYEDIRKQKDTETLEVRCAYCGKWFTPTRISVSRRLFAVNNLDKGEMRLYCSGNCKKSCPTYNQRVYPKGFKYSSSREVDPYLRKLVFERDNWRCQKCDKTIQETPIHCHHMDPVAQNPVFQNDMGSCITLCKTCHKFVHKQYGCRYIDLRCKREE